MKCILINALFVIIQSVYIHLGGHPIYILEAIQLRYVWSKGEKMNQE